MATYQFNVISLQLKIPESQCLLHRFGLLHHLHSLIHTFPSIPHKPHPKEQGESNQRPRQPMQFSILHRQPNTLSEIPLPQKFKKFLFKPAFPTLDR
jgi:hypothetical protein